MSALSLATNPLNAPPEDGATASDRAAKALEATLVRQLLSASGAFKGSDAAGAGIHADMFVEALANAVAQSDGLGLAEMLTRNMPEAKEPAPAAAPPQVRQSGGFGMRTDPIDGSEKMHTGVDLAAPTGTPITAAMDGVVRRAGPRGGYGNAVEIDHGNGLTTLYGHASSLAVREGENVRAGDTIAAVGQSGRATGPHLHFEVRMGGVPRDPKIFSTRALNAYAARAELPIGAKGTE